MIGWLLYQFIGSPAAPGSRWHVDGVDVVVTQAETKSSFQRVAILDDAGNPTREVRMSDWSLWWRGSAIVDGGR